MKLTETTLDSFLMKKIQRKLLEISNVNEESTDPNVRIRRTTPPYLGDDLEQVKAMKKAILDKTEPMYDKLTAELLDGDRKGLLRLTKETKLKWLFELDPDREQEYFLLMEGTGELSQQFRRFMRDTDMIGVFDTFADIMTEEIVQWMEENQLYGFYYYYYKQKLLEEQQKESKKKEA